MCHDSENHDARSSTYRSGKLGKYGKSAQAEGTDVLRLEVRENVRKRNSCKLEFPGQGEGQREMRLRRKQLQCMRPLQAVVGMPLRARERFLWGGMMC